MRLDLRINNFLIDIFNQILYITLSKYLKKLIELFQKDHAPIFPEYTTLYVDYENALRQELHKWGEELLLGRRTTERNIFNPDFLHSIWSRHQSGLEPDMIGKIAPIMTYEMMLRKYYDGEEVHPSIQA